MTAAVPPKKEFLAGNGRVEREKETKEEKKRRPISCILFSSNTKQTLFFSPQEAGKGEEKEKENLKKTLGTPLPSREGRGRGDSHVPTPGKCPIKKKGKGKKRREAKIRNGRRI